MVTLKYYVTWLTIIAILFNSLGIIAQNNQNLSKSNTIIVDISGNGDFASIQEAIDASSNGDTIFIYEGTYYENILISKSITLEGQNQDTTIIKGLGEKDVILITAEQVSISNIQICNSGKSGRDSGIETRADETRIENTIIKNTTIGIFLYHSNNHNIQNNILTDNKDYGLHVFHSSFNTITNNVIFNNRWGILFVYGQGNIISNNQIIDNKIHGIWLLRGSIYNSFTQNDIQYNNDKGIYLQLFCFNNSFLENRISNNKDGISIGSHWTCDNNFIQNNEITDNQEYGIILLDSTETRITENNIVNNDIQAYFIDCIDTYWNQNFWGENTKIPVLIKGKKNNLPWFNIDWNPMSSPYEIKCSSTKESLKMQNEKNDEIKTQILFPPSFTWTDIDGIDYTSPVKNQIPTPTCEAYALCVGLETMAHYLSKENFNCDLSETHLFFYSGGTAEWGVDVTDPAEYLIDYGIPDEGCFPDPHRPYDFYFESIEGWESRTIKITEWGWVDNNVESIKDALIKYGPLTICQMTRKDLDLYQSGVYMPKVSSPIQRGHVTAIIGYNDTDQCWIVRNSGGEEWGENGHFRIAYEGFDQLYSFIYPFYGGTGILYVDGLYGNFQPDVPIVRITKPYFYHTYINGFEFSTIFPYIDSIQRASPRIFGDLTVTVEAENTEYVEFYIDGIFQERIESQSSYHWDLMCSNGLYTLEVIAFKDDSISKDIIDIYVV